MNPGIEAKTVSQVMCVSVHKVYSVIEKYNKLGKTYKEGSQWGGRREENSYLSIKEEKAFLERLTQKSIMGLIISAKDIKEELEEMLNHSVSEDYIWRVFKRHQWTKKTPRPEHPKTDVEAQEEFKKNSKRTWQPPR
jgi:transposase